MIRAGRQAPPFRHRLSAVPPPPRGGRQKAAGGGGLRRGPHHGFPWGKLSAVRLTDEGDGKGLCSVLAEAVRILSRSPHPALRATFPQGKAGRRGQAPALRVCVVRRGRCPHRPEPAARPGGRAPTTSLEKGGGICEANDGGFLTSCSQKPPVSLSADSVPTPSVAARHLP